jgi:thioredoxin 1
MNKNLESIKMSTPEEKTQIEIEESNESTDGQTNLGKLSIFAAVIGIMLKFCKDAFFKEPSSAATSVEVAATIIVLAGISLGVYGLNRAWKTFGIDMLLLAGVGIFLNGGLFTMGLMKMPLPGIAGAGPMGVSAGQMRAFQEVKMMEQLDAAGIPTEVTDKNFDSVVGNCDKPVLVYFWSSQSELCKTQEPIVEEIASNYQGKVKVCKLNVDREKETATSFKLKGIPTIILFKNKQIKAKWVGVIEGRYITAEIGKLP